MRRRAAHFALQAGTAIRTRTATVTLVVAATMEAGAARADHYGLPVEGPPLRPGQALEDLAMAAAWLFCALALVVVGWAMLRFMMHFDAPKPGGLITPVVGILVAIALLVAPPLFGAWTVRPSPGFPPPILGAE